MTSERFVMRKFLLTLLMLVFLASCAHNQRGGDLRASRDSAYKVEVTLKIDLKPLNDWIAKKQKEEEERRKAEEPQSLPPTHPWGGWSSETITLDGQRVQLNSAQQQVDLHVIEQNRDFAEIGWSGTGWVAATAPGRSYVMTAGHVCESKDFYPIEVFDVQEDEAGNWSFTIETIELPIVEKHHRMVGRDGVESTDSTVMRDEDMDDDFNGPDLCMLGIGADLGPAIPVAVEEPEFGQDCAVVGAPTGLWGGGIAVASGATFSGRGSVFGTEPDGLAFNGLLAPGNSGSAVVCDGHVAGVISLGSMRFRSLIHAVSYDKIEVFMRKALHRR